MATMEELDKVAKDARSGLFPRPYEGSDVVMILQLGKGGAFVKEQWWNKAEKRPMAYTAEDKAAGREMDMPSFNISCVQLEFDPKDKRVVLSAQKKIASLNANEYTDAKKIYEEKARDSKNGWERCIVRWSQVMVKGKKKSDLRFEDYIDDITGLRAKIDAIVPFTEDELKVKAAGVDAPATSGSSGAGSDSTEFVDAATAERLAGRVKNLPNAAEDAGAFKAKFGVTKMRELKMNQVAAAEAWIGEHEKPNGAATADLLSTTAMSTQSESMIGDVFGPTGLLSQCFPGYQPRNGQVQLVRAVSGLFLRIL